MILRQPKSTLIYTAVIGLVGYVIFILMQARCWRFCIRPGGGHSVELAARRQKATTLFLISSIIPTVPGLGLYRSMMALSENNLELSLQIGAETLAGSRGNRAGADHRHSHLWLHPPAAPATITTLKGDNMHLLITNDDGITAPGILTLARVAAAAGHSVVVVAPANQQSATGHRLTINESLMVIPMDIDPNFKAFAVNGTPVDCVRIGRKLSEKPFDFCLSGINDGVNVGTDLFYSGTAAAAREAAMLYLPAWPSPLTLAPMRNARSWRSRPSLSWTTSSSAHALADLLQPERAQYAS